MTDLEITRLCAEAMRMNPRISEDDRGQKWLITFGGTDEYRPLRDDAQAMALVKKFGVEIHCRTDRNGWHVGIVESDGMVPHTDLNRAICECVAKMQAAKGNK